jgi:hydrogenase 3 maturation protease
MGEMKMSNRSWVKKFNEALTSTAGKPAARLAIVGIGNELNADDSAGILVKPYPSERLLLVEAGPSPENFTAPLRRFQPDLVLLIDAVQMQAKPGSMAWLEWQNVEGFSASTHTLPPTLLGQFLCAELNCLVALLGIQVDSVEFDHPIHPAVKRSAARISGRLSKILRERNY